MGRKREKVLAVPFAEAALGEHPTQKTRSAVDVLHLADRGITKLGDGMQLYKFLEVLWLSNNKLRRLSGLQHNNRLKEMYLNQNELGSLSEIRHLKALEVLLLRDNALTGLAEICGDLQRLPRLRQLDLSNNALMNEPNAREYLLYHLPQLDVLNQHVVTTRERVQADKLARNLGWGVNGSSSPRAKQPLVRARTMPAPAMTESVLERAVHRKVHRIHRWRAAQRRAAARELSEHAQPPEGCRPRVHPGALQPQEHRAAHRRASGAF